LEAAIENAKHLHFQYLRLEVIPTLIKAKKLYHSFGFYTIEPYQTVAMEGTAYMEKHL
jgi:putative acetyltransferase